MALFQDIMKVPGLSGTALQRQAQLYKQITGKTDYNGSSSQNNMLLKNLGGARGTATIAPKPAAAPADWASSMKTAFSESDLLKAGARYEEINPWSQFFNEERAKQTRDKITNIYKPDFDRQNEDRAYGDQTFRRDNTIAFNDNMSTTRNNLAANGALFGGVRQGVENKLNTSNNNYMADYQRRFETEKFNAGRQQNRTIEQGMSTEEGIAKTEYNEKKNKFALDSLNIPGYSF